MVGGLLGQSVATMSSVVVEGGGVAARRIVWRSVHSWQSKEWCLVGVGYAARELQSGVRAGIEDGPQAASIWLH